MEWKSYLLISDVGKVKVLNAFSVLAFTERVPVLLAVVGDENLGSLALID